MAVSARLCYHTRTFDTQFDVVINMRHFLAAVAVILFGILTAQSATAQDAFGVCAAGEKQCRALAIATNKVAIAEQLQLTRPQFDPGQFLCPEDNPNCCPPRLMPVCMEHGTLIIDQTLILMRAKQKPEKCPFSAEICDSLAGFYCGPDASWTPWTGCHTIADPVLPDPPRPCPMGQVFNGKICIPQKCFHPTFGVEIPCRPLGDGQFAALRSDRMSTVMNVLQDEAIAERARSEMVQELNEALKALSGN